MIYPLTNPAPAAPLFGDWPETMLWSCLQGVMGGVWADDPQAPCSAMAALGDFAFLAGRPSAALLKAAPCPHGMILLVPRAPGWEAAMAAAFRRCRAVTRYATRKEPDAFDRDRLRRAAACLPAGYSLRPIDAALYEVCARREWSRDLVSNFRDAAHYQSLGLGVVALYRGEPVAGASSYSRYRTGIEIEIDTCEEHRRQGLAAACGAQLILNCLDRGLYPSWDAQNKASLALAEKLGYHFSHAYTAYEAAR